MGDGARLQWATDADYAEISDVIYDAVRHGPSRYTEAQRAAWVPTRRSDPEWTAQLDAQAIVVAEDAGHITGLMSLTDGNYIDFAFIRPAAQGTGLFRRLFGEIEQRARADGQTRLWVHASLMAAPAFAAVGFVVVEAQMAAIGDQQLERCHMEILLDG